MPFSVAHFILAPLLFFFFAGREGPFGGLARALRAHASSPCASPRGALALLRALTPAEVKPELARVRAGTKAFWGPCPDRHLHRRAFVTLVFGFSPPRTRVANNSNFLCGRCRETRQDPPASRAYSSAHPRVRSAGVLVGTADDGELLVRASSAVLVLRDALTLSLS